ncbi:MAG TPA: TetR/AcrR family transcriptional regulator [Propionicimonas sp.]|nr:TetR/AcrR family transcriptional regulator [Propionicimonas sp.]HQA77350.1 TetR/AcrR family transcriptional regulator [Propionicimonas sp.]HQD97070.1 TetR/AcrR family transcriptional regulator [Propionicimonas sp.]
MSSAAATSRARRSRVRMTRAERREQLIDVARALFAERGLEGTSVEEIAAHAGVSKPVVYEHFGGKEGLYAVVVDREVRTLHDAIRTALTTPRANPRALIELGALALLDYIDDHPNGFRIISRDSSATSPEGSFATILSDIASRVEGLLANEFTKRELDAQTAPMYAQMLVGLVALAGQWWMDTREEQQLDKPVVAAHLVNLAWYGMRNLRPNPTLYVRERAERDS